MTRVVMVKLDEGDVVRACDLAGVGVSALEQLPEGGVRLVCMSKDGAEVMRRKFKSKLITAEPRRMRHRPSTPLW